MTRHHDHLKAKKKFKLRNLATVVAQLRYIHVYQLCTLLLHNTGRLVFKKTVFSVLEHKL